MTRVPDADLGASACAARPFPVSLVRTALNGGSVAAVLAVLEQELPAGSYRAVLLRDASSFDGDGLLVQSFMSARAARVAAEMAALRARLGPRLLAVAGGPHPSGRPEETLAMGFDWVAAGEAGPPFAALVRALAEGRSAPRGVIDPSPRLPLDHYPPWPGNGQLFATIEITRGCPIGCAFCQTPALHGSQPRHRSLEALERAFRHAVETGHTFTRFVAPNAFAYGGSDGRRGDPRAIEGLLRTARRCGMRRVYLGSFPSEVRPESVTTELLQLLKDHCDNRGVVVGIQSGSPEMLARLRRGHTVEEAERAVALIAGFGLQPRIDFIFGLPGETDADRHATRQLMVRLMDDHGARINTHVFTPLPGTPLEGTRPTAIDPATRELLERIIGQGRANKPLREFGSNQPADLSEGPPSAASSGGTEPPAGCGPRGSRRSAA